MSAKSTSCDHHDGRKGEIMKRGYLKKLKTMKKKYFILRGESSEASARLEYYDSEKKWKNAQPPKRTISLKTCFNINRRRDTKQKYVIALYTKDDCFCIVLDTEKDLQEWLEVLLKLQTGEDTVDGEPPRPTFEHVWKVTLQEKGLGDSKNLVGPYHVCLTDQTLSLVKIPDNDDAKLETLDFPLIHIRSCGVTGSFFYIEVGRQTVTGAGALWMLTEDANIAKNMNAVIFSAFSLKQKDQKDADPHRKRSSSATESSKPTSLLQRRQTHGGNKPLIPSGYSEDGAPQGHCRTSCAEADPTPAITTISEHSTHAVPVVSSLALPAHSRASVLHYAPRPPSQRRHSVSAMSSSSMLGTSTMVQHHRTNSIPLSSNSESSDTVDAPALTVSHQRTKSCPVSESSVPVSPSPAGDETLEASEPRRNSNPLCPIHRDRINSQSSVDFARCHPGDGAEVRRSSVGGRRPGSAMKSTTTGTRERSDSMPSRARTTSEGNHHVVPALPHATRIPYHGSRPHSMHSRGLSYSPPAASGPCSTDSAGSSLSIDDGDVELAVSATSPRYGHSSTPDGPAIIEENSDDYAPWPHGTVEAVEEEMEKIDEYVQMDRPAPSLSLPIHASTAQRKISAPASLKSSSPMHSYMDMCSPCGSSPLETANYLPMSPGEGGRRPVGPGSNYSANHSRGSSFAEETPDGYVPMAPNPTDDGYVDMEPLPGHRLHGEDCHHSDMSPGSSCSFTSGTPSTDMRFSEYHLEKVSSYFTPSEEDEISSTDRPSRTYSFGSQPDSTKSKAKLEVANSVEAGRVRAFSVGSKWGRPRNLTKEAHKLPSRSHVLPQSSKSSSAPLLSSSWSGSSKQAQLDPMADLMEIDFTDNKKKKRGGSRFRVTPVMESSSQLNLDHKSSLHTVVTSSADSGYMDMSSKSPSGIFPISKTHNGNDINSASPPRVISGSPRTPGLNAAFGKSPPKALGFGRSPPKLNSYFGRSPPKSSPLACAEGPSSKPLTISSLFSPPEISRSEPKNTRPTKPAIISSSTLKTIGERPDVKPQKFPTTSSANLNICALPNKMFAPTTNSPRQQGAYMDMRIGVPDTQPAKEDQNYMEMRGPANRKFTRANSDKDVQLFRDAPSRSTPEGYVEMSWGASAAKLTKKSSTDNFNVEEDYMPMSGSGSGSSQPIAIRGSSSSSPIQVGRTTPPKVPPNFLALGNSSPFGSMKRNVRRKNRRKHERRGSKENVTTPTGSNSAIFPLSLNSPLSPKKSPTSLTEANESVTPTNSPRESTETSPMDESPYTEMNMNDEDSPYAEMTPGVELEDRSYSDILSCKENEAANLVVPLSRVLRISSKDNSPTSHDYMNFTPFNDETKSSEEFGDYAVMKPLGVKERKISAPVLGYLNRDNGVSLTRKPGSITEIPLNTSTSVPFSATANISDPKSVVAHKCAFPSSEGGPRIARQASSPLPHKPFAKSKTHTPKDIENQLSEEKPEESPRLSSSNIDNSRSSSLNMNDAHSSISRQISTSSTSSSEFGDRKSSLKLGENHSGVTRQVSTSSSSSTEVMSVKEASSPVPPAAACSGASRPSSVSSERDITYASLDLAPSGSEGEESARSPRGLRSQSSLTESSGSSPSPNPTVPPESFNYVEIDFEKSATLRAPQSFSKKIRH